MRAYRSESITFYRNNWSARSGNAGCRVCLCWCVEDRLMDNYLLKHHYGWEV